MASIKDRAPRQEDGTENDPVLRRLRQVYDDVAAEPLPDKLLDLLEKLDKAERNR